MVCGRIPGIELYRPAEFTFGRIKVPVVAIQAERERIMRFAEGVIQLQCFQRSGLCLRHRIFGGHQRILPISQQSKRVCQSAVSRSVVWVFGYGLVEVIDGFRFSRSV